jgi:formyl-CoA transferase
VLGGNSDVIFARLARLMGQPELATDPKFHTNADRVANMAELDRIIGTWIAKFPADELQRMLEEAEVPAGRVYTIDDCAKDAHFQARGMLQAVEIPEAGQVLQPGVVPKFEDGGPGAACAGVARLWARTMSKSTEEFWASAT